MMRTDSIAATPRSGAIARDGVVAVNETRRTAALTLAAIEAPEDIRLEHLALVTALEDLVADVDRFLADTAELDDKTFGTAVDEAIDLQSRALAVGGACDALGRRIAGLGLDGDIRC